MAQVKFDLREAMKLLDKAQKRLVAVGFALERDIKESMTTGTGRISIKSSKGNKSTIHIASAPGQPPAVDTGRLRASISTNWSDSGMSRGRVGGQADSGEGVGSPEKMDGKFMVVIGTNVKYAPWLCWGTRRMGARPFVRPAWDRMKSRIANMLTKEIEGRTE